MWLNPLPKNWKSNIEIIDTKKDPPAKPSIPSIKLKALVKLITENIVKTNGGLELAEKHREDIRYRKGIIISSGPEMLKEKDQIVFDKVAGHDIEDNKNIYDSKDIRGPKNKKINNPKILKKNPLINIIKTEKFFEKP